VLPARFRCLATTATAEEYASQVHGLLSYFASYEAKTLLPVALKLGDAEQQAALSKLPPPERTYKQPHFTS